MKSLLKKWCFSVMAGLLIVMAMALTVQAAEIMYVSVETAMAYEDRSTDSDVLAVFYGGNQILVEDFRDNWC